MKRSVTLLLVLSLLLCGCGARPVETEPSTEVTQAPTGEVTEAPTEEVTEAPTEEVTEAPTEPAFRNPLTGEPLEAPVETRIVSVSIGSTGPAMPCRGLSQADIVFEMYVNNCMARMLALFTDVSQVKDIGSLRSQRYHFTDISQSYDTIAISASGSNAVLRDVSSSGIDYINMNIDDTTDYSYRDRERLGSGFAWEHCLFVKGEGVYDRAAKLGFRTSMDPEKDYKMLFAQDKALTEGQSANTVRLTFLLGGYGKDSIFHFNPETGLYEITQFDKELMDENTEQNVAFRNVFVLLADTWTDADGYQISNILGSGSGYFACDGYMVPIQWHRETEEEPFSFTLEDGTALRQGVGSSYIAIAATTSTVTSE